MDQDDREGSDARAAIDAGEVLRRIEADERDALETRARYQTHGLPRRGADPMLQTLLAEDEAVVDVHEWAVVNREPIGTPGDLFAGRLYLTTRRLILLGARPLELDLGAIEEIDVAGERLLITLRDASGMTIEAARPRVLRVQIAATLTAARV